MPHDPSLAAANGPAVYPGTGSKPSLINIEEMRLSQDFTQTAGVEKVVLTVPVRKPSKETFFRVHAGEDYQLTTSVLELKEDGGETYLIAPSLRESLAAEPTFGLRLLLTGVTRQGDVFVWPVRLARADGKVDTWSRSALEAANLAKTAWVRMAANMRIGGYDVCRANGVLSEPAWPSMTFQDLLSIAFKDHYIDTPDHPVLKRLRGEV